MATIPSSNPLHLSTTPPPSVKYSSGTDSPRQTPNPQPPPPPPPQMTVPWRTTSLRSASATGAAPERRQSSAKQRMQVEVGFSPYSEKINGRIAILWLTALLLADLATGKGVINYHTPAIILIQVYFVAVVGGVWIKYEKESVGVRAKP